LFAVLLFHESPTAKQWLGVTVILSSVIVACIRGIICGVVLLS
jgi:drug/metabolite transporter (DMT)-like permease